MELKGKIWGEKTPLRRGVLGIRLEEYRKLKKADL